MLRIYKKDMKSHKELMIEKREQMRDYEYKEEKRLKRKQEKEKRISRKHRYDKWQEKEE